MKATRVAWVTAMWLASGAAAWAQDAHVFFEAVDNQGKPLQGVHCVLTTEKNLPKYGDTNKRGFLSIRFLDFGRYVIECSKEGYKVVNAEYYVTTEKPGAVIERLQKIEDEMEVDSAQAIFIGFAVVPVEDIKYDFKITLAPEDEARSIWAVRARAAGGIGEPPPPTVEERVEEAVRNAVGENLSFDEAMTSVTADIKKAKEEEVMEGLAHAYQRAGKMGEARTAFARVAEVKASPDLWAKAAMLSREAQEHAQAVSFCEKALAIDAGHDEALWVLGQAHEDAGQKTEAIGAYERLTEVRPDYLQGYNRLVVLYGETGQNKKAQEANKRLRELSADQGEEGASGIGLYNEGLLCLKQNDTACAIKGFEGALEADPTLVSARYHLGILYMRQGKCDKVVEHFSVYVEKPSKDDPPEYLQTAKSLIAYCKTQ
ncbi:MAG: tetratricopeptide repeat protein [Acidobacteriota bacterium]|nr:MAG: tetratricopeptide repeat protein [Acidobacteriota bacterium]